MVKMLPNFGISINCGSIKTKGDYMRTILFLSLFTLIQLFAFDPYHDSDMNIWSFLIKVVLVYGTVIYLCILIYRKIRKDFTNK